jgi:hypothetical protein
MTRPRRPGTAPSISRCSGTAPSTTTVGGRCARGRTMYQVPAPDTLPSGRHQLCFEFGPTGKPDITQGKGSPGRAQLYIDGKLIAQDEFPLTTPIAFNPGGLTCGANPGSPVTTDYQARSASPAPCTQSLSTCPVT